MKSLLQMYKKILSMIILWHNLCLMQKNKPLKNVVIFKNVLARTVTPIDKSTKTEDQHVIEAHERGVYEHIHASVLADAQSEDEIQRKSNTNTESSKSMPLIYSSESIHMVTEKGTVQDQFSSEDFVDVYAKILADIAITRALTSFEQENQQDEMTTTSDEFMEVHRAEPVPYSSQEKPVAETSTYTSAENVKEENEDREEYVPIIVHYVSDYATNNTDHDQCEFGHPIRRGQFYLDDKVVFLNHGSFGAMPKDVVRKLERVVKDHETNPDEFERVKCLELMDQSLHHIAQFMGADSNDMSFVESTTRGIKRIFAAVDIENGDEIVINNWTVKGVRKVVNSVCKLFTGVKCITLVHELPVKDKSDILEQYNRLLQSHSRVKIVIVDHISSAPSVLFPVSDLVKLCHAHGVMVVINGAHAPGHLDLQLNKLNADFYVGNLSKWAFAPTGCSFIWTHPCHKAKMVEIKHLFRNDREVSKTHFISAKYALDFINRIGGMNRIHEYNTLLLDTATVELAEAWNTNVLSIPNDMEAPFMRSVQLPYFKYIPRTPEGASDLFQLIWTKYNIWAPVYCCNRKLYVRISAHVYCVSEDYIRLRDAVIEVLTLEGRQVQKVYSIDKHVKQTDDNWSVMSLALNS